MQLYFIRHAQSINNRLYSLTGSSAGRSEDPEITPLGRRQASTLAHFLAHGPAAPGPIDAVHPDDEPSRPSGEAQATFDVNDLHNRRGFGITHLYSSLMLRAVSTGEFISQALGLPLVAWPDLHEAGGIYFDDKSASAAAGAPVRVGLPGKSRSYFTQHHPGLRLPEDLDETGWYNRPFEERPERFARARRFLDEVCARHTAQDRVAVVSHGAFYAYMLHTLFRIPIRMDQDFPQWFALNNCAISRFDFTDQPTVVVYLNRADFLPAELIT